jgi:choline dehydrogenase-like flavoprotein
MLFDARQLVPGTTIQADICIIGAGAAGITLAKDLAGSRYEVAVLESGDVNFDPDTQSLYAGSILGRAYPPLDRDRLRYLGGGTNHWQGSCRPFSASDLEDWPFGLEILEPYYRRAQVLCQLGPYTYNPQDWATADVYALKPTADSKFRSSLFQYNAPTRFGQVYRSDLASARNLKLYLNANVLEIQANGDASEITGLRVGCLNGSRFRAHARLYILATGGIENVRLLLNSDQQQKTGLGNANDLVGRYFMDHPYIPATATILADASRPELRFYEAHAVRGQLIEGFLHPTDEVMRAEHLPPLAIRITSAPVEPDMVNVSLPETLQNHLSAGAISNLAFSLNILRKPLTNLYRKMWTAPPGTYVTSVICGPRADPQSRVTLSTQVDALGLRQSQLTWKLPDDFERQMRRSHELLAQELGRTGLGRMYIHDGANGHNPMQDLSNGHHHMGTTRMSDDPRLGVVDRDCRVHGINNLFIAGSSVFPSFACDDPTMTIVALALRLSDKLKETLS